MKIDIKYHADIKKLEMDEKGDWCDLRVAENVFIPHRECVRVSFGVSMKLPEGYEAHIAPRSSTYKNFGLIQTNGVGVVDNSYCGDNDVWMADMLCMGGKDLIDGRVGTILRKNDRICHFRITKRQDKLEFNEVESIGDKNRGGFGTSGKR